MGPLFFTGLENGDKKADVTKNDRDFKCGDFLLLREWEGKYSGNKLVVKVTHILPLDGLVVGGGNWVMMSVSHIEENDIQPFMEAVIGGVQ